ncbi:MAG: biosynthetic arginine decarboxylase [Pseudomonadales bacterium]
MNKLSPVSWSAQDAAELYRVSDWGAGYFSVSAKGELQVSPFADDPAVCVSLVDIISGIRDRGMDMPVLLRIENLLDNSLSRLNEAFAAAIEQAGYQSCYRGVFPIKVNQQCHVIEEIARFGSRYHHGLEAGSKAELLVALANIRDDDSCIVCNGYKDQEFIDLGLMACQLGVNCFFVIETPNELPLILERSEALGVSPMIGLRLKLTTQVDGHWSKDSGDRSLFGLTTAQLIDIVDQLKLANKLDCLQLLHFHLGSQITNIRNVRSGLQEACRVYVDLKQEGAGLGYLDLGGGLAVDYDGSRSNTCHSKNYQLDEYCADIVETIMDILDPLGIEHPVIITESGRATVAHSSVLLFNCLSVTHFDPAPLSPELPEDSPELMKNLLWVLETVRPDNLQECYNDALYYRDEIREEFRRGEVKLRTTALAENLFLAILQRIVQCMPEARRVPAELENLHESLADIYYGNFSVFQSLPDSWAIEQVFPIMPVHRLGEKPTRRAIIADLTCDCDGKIDRFIDGQSTLPVHSLKDDEDYMLGIFLVGAYQETLGDLHNLFGDTHVVSARINRDGSYDFVREIEGDSIADVLNYVEYYPQALVERFRNTAEQAVRSGRISAAVRKQMMEAFSASLRGYTYFEK